MLIIYPINQFFKQILYFCIMRITSLDISEHKHAVLADFFENLHKFRTSLNIIGEVLNVPLCALKSILRQNGHSDVDPSDYCIDEKELEMFAEAYIRKMKCYFTSSIRNISTLSFEEETDLNKFYNQFKKEECNHLSSANWNQIDTNKIRIAFMDQVEEKTKSPSSLLAQNILQMLEIRELPSKRLSIIDRIVSSQEDKEIQELLNSLYNKNVDTLQLFVLPISKRADSLTLEKKVTKHSWYNIILRIILIAIRCHINTFEDSYHDFLWISFINVTLSQEYNHQKENYEHRYIKK